MRQAAWLIWVLCGVVAVDTLALRCDWGGWQERAKKAGYQNGYNNGYAEGHERGWAISKQAHLGLPALPRGGSFVMIGCFEEGKLCIIKEGSTNRPILIDFSSVSLSLWGCIKNVRAGKRFFFPDASCLH